MTEDEAKTKWCPFARVAWMEGQFPDGYAIPVNRQATGERTKEHEHLPPEPKCIGSSCMAWREIKPTGLKFIPCDDQFAFIEPSRPDHVPNSWLWNNGTPEHLLAHYQNSQAAGWRESEEAARERLGGYCGLAGNP